MKTATGTGYWMLKRGRTPVLTTESVEHLELHEGDKVKLIIKAIHVLPVKD